MNKKKPNNSQNKKMNNTHISSNYTEYPELTDNEKKKLQVKDGQNNHHIDERGGY